MEKFDFEKRFYTVNMAIVNEGDSNPLMVCTEDIKTDDIVADIEFFYANN